MGVLVVSRVGVVLVRVRVMVVVWMVRDSEWG